MIVGCVALLLLTCGYNALNVTNTRNLVLFLIFLVALVVFYRLETTRPHPLIDLAYLKNPTFTLAALAYFCLGGCLNGASFFIPLYLNQAQGFTATQAGAFLIAVDVGLIAATSVTGRAVQKKGRYRLLLVIGSALFTSFFLTAYFYAHYNDNIFIYIISLAWFGMGFGFVLPLYPIAMQAVVPSNRLGSATSAIRFSRQLGSSIGSALMGTLFVVALHSQLPAQIPHQMSDWVKHVHYVGFEEKTVLEQRLKKLVTRLEAELISVVEDKGKLEEFLQRYSYLTHQFTPLFKQGRITKEKAVSTLNHWALLMQKLLDEAVDKTLAIGLREIFLIGSLLSLLALAAAVFIPIHDL